MRDRIIKKEYKFLSAFWKLQSRKHTVLGLRSFIRLVVRGFQLRPHTHGSSSEISTMNSVTKYPTSTIDKNTPTDRRQLNQSQESSSRTLFISTNGTQRSTPTWRAGGFGPFIITASDKICIHTTEAFSGGSKLGSVVLKRSLKVLRRANLKQRCFLFWVTAYVSLIMRLLM